MLVHNICPCSYTLRNHRKLFIGFLFRNKITIKFCKKCKTLLNPLEKEGRFFLECKKCGFVDEVKKNLLITSEKIKRPKKIGEGSVKDKDIFATYNHICKKCGYDKAEVIDMGIFYSDEDNLIFLKCGKCGFSERIGRKVS